ncbi:hypothetical protein IWZ01DRAFT_545926 [Phyllosticta capitalensis]
MAFSPPPKIPGAFPRSATPSPQKQPAPQLPPNELPPVPALTIPALLPMDQQPAAIPASSEMVPIKTAVPPFGHTDRTSTGSDQMHMAIPAGGQMDEQSMAVPAEKQTDHSAAAITALRQMDHQSSSSCGSGVIAVERVDSPLEEQVTPTKAHSVSSNEDPFDDLDAPDNSLTALPSMDESPEKLRLSQESAVSLDLDKDLPAPPPTRRLFSFRTKDKSAAKESSTRDSSSTTRTTASDETVATRASKARRVITSVGGGLRSLKLMNRSTRVVPSQDSTRSSPGKFTLQSFDPFKDRYVSPVKSSEAPRAKSEEFKNPDWLEFPIPPGAHAINPDQMRIRAALDEQEQELESLRLALEDSDPPDVDPVDWSSPAMHKARRRSRKKIDRGMSSGPSSPDSITTVKRHRRRRPFKPPVSRSSSTETVIRHPVAAPRRSSSTETVIRHPVTTSAANDDKTRHETATGSNSATNVEAREKDESSHHNNNRSACAKTPPNYSLFPSIKDPRERPAPVRPTPAARRASVPARLPLSPALLGQPVHAAGPSARSSPAVASPASLLSRRTSTNADHRAARRQSRNFSRPFAIAGHEAVDRREESPEMNGEMGDVGLACSVGDSPVKTLQSQQVAASSDDSMCTPIEGTPDDWPLGPGSVDSSELDKPLPKVPEEE